MFRKTFLAAGLAAVLGVSAQAHQIIAQSVGANKFEAKFWAHGSFEKYKPQQLLGAKAYDKDLQEIKTGLLYNYGSDKTPEILTDKAPAVIVANFDAGYWVETNKGYIVGDKLSAKGIVFDAIKSVKIGKSYFSWNEKMLKPLGLKLEVIALANPFKLKVGDKLPVLVLKDGKPLAGAGFEDAKDDLSEVTNEFGIALIPVKAKGLNIIAARASESIFNDAKADTLFMQSSISFELK